MKKILFLLCFISELVLGQAMSVGVIKNINILNICPIGFHVATQPEFAALITAAGITNSATAYSSSLKLTVAGARDRSSAGLSGQGSNGYYWSGSVTGTNAYYLTFDASSMYSA